MSILIDYGVSRRFVGIALALLAVIYIVRLTPQDMVPTPSFLGAKPETNAVASTGAFQIKDKVALISDTQYSPRLVPLILHFHAVLGPAWPIVFYTSNETNAVLAGSNGTRQAAIWHKTVASGAIDVRVIPDTFDLTTRRGVNLYLSRPWLWEQLAPAKHVLVFQTDAMLCANAYETVDDFLEWDFIGAPLHTKQKFFNGGLSLRSRDRILDILRNPANNWENEVAAGTWTLGGEDVWFSRRMEESGAHLPDFNKAITFACQHTWHIDHSKTPLGYHKVHKVAAKFLDEIADWCPEIALAAPGKLEQAE
ncbi:hypothetical protein SPBR_00842 [Sporothrix brasiliensis 5110]|uniref:DUF5672 domain-containing protein n=1 Tax=Sporothrix brasiliensis 5110 TaxID=1398154 RepID=A0A0C2IXW0_9PEZI|nr:uncharacterized protein SPBR_00842 [Sporothrix brasiliensis 5110]KIH89872.1 hypothetical protein SPBR_00842 [Sporothrix brasiliensis 5110]